MLKIMLVEDEPIVRRCLRDTIDWSKYDCTICGEASDAIEALRLCAVLCPDIIITDIVIDNGSGLEMIEELRKQKNNVEIIILTGYDNFTFAQRALANNVAAYILKPIQNEVIIEEILKLKEKIREKQRINRAFTEYASKNRNLFLEKLISEENLSPQRCDELAAECDISLPSDIYCAAILKPDKNPNDTPSSPHTELASLREAVTYCTATSQFFSLFCDFENNELLIMVFWERRDEQGELDAFLTDLHKRYNSTTGNTLTIGVSGIFKNVTIVHRAVNQAKKACLRRTLLGRNRIIQYTEQPLDNDEFPVLTSEQINSVVSDIKNLNAAHARYVVCAWLDSSSNYQSVNIDMIKNNILELVLLILRSAVQNTASMKTVFGRTLLPAAELQRIEFISELKAWISDIITCIENHPDTCVPYNYSHMIQKSVLFIHKNYPSNITIEQLAAILFVSPRTLTRMFKKETGKTFREYLTEYRIKAAVELLQSGNYKVYEVSELVGYHDTKHFHKTFKKLTGHSPGHYRKNDGSD